MNSNQAEPYDTAEPVSRLLPGRHLGSLNAAPAPGGELAVGPASRRQASLPAQPKLLEGLRVLVCEDDPDSRELLHAVLDGEGATVCVAAAAVEALEHFRDFRPDVLVSDIGMPVMDGYALIRHIRALGDDDGGRTPAIALTAYAGREDARRAFAAGYHLHVPKPVDPGELAAMVATLAGRSGSNVETR